MYLCVCNESLHSGCALQNRMHSASKALFVSGSPVSHGWMKRWVAFILPYADMSCPLYTAFNSSHLSIRISASGKMSVFGEQVIQSTPSGRGRVPLVSTAMYFPARCRASVSSSVIHNAEFHEGAVFVPRVAERAFKVAS